MPRNKHSKDLPPSPSSIPLEPDQVMNELSFESLEDKIRGEDVMISGELKNIRQREDDKKKFDSSELDRRLEDLKKKLGSDKKR
jgi:hypothetical protein